jgi:hypothetical protein
VVDEIRRQRSLRDFECYGDFTPTIESCCPLQSIECPRPAHGADARIEDQRHANHETSCSELRLLSGDRFAGRVGVFPGYVVERQLRHLLHLVGMGYMVRRSMAFFDRSSLLVSVGWDSDEALTPMMCS